MFRRRDPLPIARRAAALLWPPGGWRRYGRYLLHRLSRMGGSPYTLAAGLACGAAVSFLPAVGLHFVLGALLALAMRGSVLASAIGTWVGNPWTFPFIWMASYELGVRLLAPGAAPPSVDFAQFFARFGEALARHDADAFADALWPVWFPMLVGSLPLAAGAWVATYVPTWAFIRQRRLARLRRRQAVPSHP